MSLGEDSEADSGQVIDADVTVDDEEYNNRRRIQAINDARDRVDRALMKSRAREMEGLISQTEARKAVRTAVRIYFRQVRSTVQNELGIGPTKDKSRTNGHEEPIEETQKTEIADLLRSKPLGHMNLQPPRPRRDYERITDNLPNQCEFAERRGTVIGIRGIYGVIELPSPIRTRWYYTDDHPVTGGGERSDMSTTAIPRKVSLRAAEHIDALLQKLGLGLQMEESEQHTHIDRELLEEVEEWRQKNIEN